MFASVFGGAFNARYGHLHNSEFHTSNMEIAFKRKHEGTQTVTSGIMRLHLRNMKITMAGKHTMRIGQSDLNAECARLTYGSALHFLKGIKLPLLSTLRVF